MGDVYEFELKIDGIWIEWIFVNWDFGYYGDFYGWFIWFDWFVGLCFECLKRVLLVFISFCVGLGYDELDWRE